MEAEQAFKPAMPLLLSCLRCACKISSRMCRFVASNGLSAFSSFVG